MYALISTLIMAGSVAAAVTSHPSARDVDSAACNSPSGTVNSWTVSGFDLHYNYEFTTPAHQVSSGTVSFNLTSPAISYSANCQATSTQLQDLFFGDVVYECDVPNETDRAAFSFDRPSNVLNITHTWACAGAGPTDPRWTGVGKATLNLDCSTSSYQNSDWQEGEIYSNEVTTCEPLDVVVPIETIAA